MRDIAYGLAGGLIGAAVWAGVVYLTEYEIGWIAWGVGALVGYAVALGNRDRSRSPTSAGVIAVVITALSIIAGKYAAVELMMPSDEDLVAAFTDGFDHEEFVISFVADEVLEEYLDADRALVWPEGADREYPTAQGDYPVEIWAEAELRWDRWTEEQQAVFTEERRAETRADVEASLPELRAAVSRGGFFASFAPMDLIFFGLGMVTAWGMGSGAKSRGDVEAAYRSALLLSMIRMMVSDGEVEDSEVASIRSILTEVLGTEVEEEEIRREAANAAADKHDLISILRDIGPHLDTAQRETVVRSAILVGLANGSVSDEEQRLVGEMAQALDVTDSHLHGILAGVVSG